MTEKRKATAAHMKATAKYEQKAYDKILLRLPKGTKERIQAVSDSVNGYVVGSVLNSLVMDERIKQAENVPETSDFLPFS